jgi:restriction system protein
MAIPDYQTIFLPLLKFVSTADERSLRESIDFLSDEFELSEEERKELLPSGKQRIFDNRVAWAVTYIRKACLIETIKRGQFYITDRGRQVLKRNPERIDNNFLNQFPEFVEFRKPKKKTPVTGGDGKPPSDERNPEEILESAYQELQDSLADELLYTIKTCSSEFFERLVVDVLLKMGYGGSRKEAGQAMDKTGDGGIDGIIKEDKLGLDIIYIQAKRWENTTVGRPEIQKFAGALLGKKARKGIFLTTSIFSKEALEYAAGLESKIILIDGHRLAELMIDHGVGVNTVNTYEIKKIDSDYFIEG